MILEVITHCNKTIKSDKSMNFCLKKNNLVNTKVKVFSFSPAVKIIIVISKQVKVEKLCQQKMYLKHY